MALAATPRQRSAPAVLVAAALLSLSLSLSCAQAQAPHVAVPPSAPPKAAAPGPAAGLSAACLNSLLNMTDCLPYVQAGSKARAPEKPCCPELAGMVGSNPVCLCELLSGAADSLGIAVDYARALALPGVCRVATPPLSTCAGSNKLTRALPLQVAAGFAALRVSIEVDLICVDIILAAMGYNVRLGPSPAPAPGSPSPMSPGDSPQYPAGPSPFASPPASPKPSHAARSIHAAGVLVALAASFAVGIVFF
ncbi:non-specific lipid transfer protein GPI-anchored 2-like isoform X1 [Triticum dicoccoides]|uniref:non-specific lipid transfer protein GPI-anchored 2-like isoform X1 n=1 Tax=Triticum dicoccoides TaxID=85692 RepID=UPI00188FAF88|nr:non-specific lipid transfer protein GPI-anchored 2-like isoform X1 [Triticum dicoccoides]